MAETLYRKYRPKNFADLVDQQHIRITLEHALEHDRVAHAYLFAGPRGVGKTSVARVLARAVNCLNRGKASEPCNTCANCTAILQNRSLDIIEIDAASQTGVDNVRDNIIQSARSIPSGGKYKVFIIDEVHMLSLAAFNALLKLLEEPPAHAMFILATTEIHRIPETIISRTQRFDFKKIKTSDIVNRLREVAKAEKRELGDGVAERIARQSGGSLRDAESMLGQLFSFKEKNITAEVADLVLPRSDTKLALQIMEALIRGNAADAVRAFHAFTDEGGDIEALVRELISMSRASLLSTIEPTLLQEVMGDLDDATLSNLVTLAKDASTASLTVMVEHLLEAQRQLHRAVLMELPVEVALIKIASTANVSSPPTFTLPVTTSTNPTTKEEPKPEVKAKPAPKVGKTGKLALSEVQQAWSKLRTAIRKTHPSLGLLVQTATVAKIEGDEVILGVPYKLHVSRLNDQRSRDVLEPELGQVVGTSLRLRAEYDPEAGTDVPAVVMETPAFRPSITPAPAPAAPISGSDPWDQIVASFS